MVKTTISIKEINKQGLDKLKVHPRQTYDEVIEGLLKK